MTIARKFAQMVNAMVGTEVPDDFEVHFDPDDIKPPVKKKASKQPKKKSRKDLKKELAEINRKIKALENERK